MRTILIWIATIKWRQSFSQVAKMHSRQKKQTIFLFYFKARIKVFVIRIFGIFYIWMEQTPLEKISQKVDFSRLRFLCVQRLIHTLVINFLPTVSSSKMSLFKSRYLITYLGAAPSINDVTHFFEILLPLLPPLSLILLNRLIYGVMSPFGGSPPP